MKESAIYVHIPFCDHKCIYCDFYSVVNKTEVNNYQEKILNEIQYYSNEYSQDRIFTSIFLGGGTPSLMEPEYIDTILNAIKAQYNIDPHSEVTLETNPGTVDLQKLKDFHSIGINRISIGVQSFINEELKFLTRIHDKDTAIKAVCDAEKAGFNNISIDLIYNLPGQTKDSWVYNLETAVNLPIKHISAYSLILEGGTQLNKLVKDGKIVLPDIDYDGEIYELTIDTLKQNSFHQYEVSNYAKQGYECMHNKAYWHYRDYLAFGASAHSFMNGRRWWNYSNLRLYMLKIDELGNAVAGYEELTQEQMLSEFIMLALRSSGLDLQILKQKFGNDWINNRQSYLKALERRGLIYFQEEMITLTKKGYAVCDEILEKIL